MARNFTLELPVGLWIGDTGPVNAGDKAALHVQDTATGPSLEFKDGSDEYAAYTQRLPMPDEYTGSGTLKLDLYWCCAASAGKVNWEAYFEAIATGESVTPDHYDSANDAGGITVPGIAYNLAKTTITLTNKDSVAAGELIRLLLRRDSDDATDDTAVASAYLLAAELYEET